MSAAFDLHAIVQNFAAAQLAVAERARFNAAEEALADEALLALFKLREALVSRDANSLACRVDEVMEDLYALARKAVR